MVQYIQQALIEVYNVELPTAYISAILDGGECVSLRLKGGILVNN